MEGKTVKKAILLALCAAISFMVFFVGYLKGASDERTWQVVRVELSSIGGDGYREVRTGQCATFLVNGKDLIFCMHDRDN